MQDIIRKIIELDHRAQKMANETEDLRRTAGSSVEEDKKKLREETLSKARGRIRECEEAEDAALQKSLEEIRAKRARLETFLKQAAAANHGRWVEELYNRVLGR